MNSESDETTETREEAPDAERSWLAEQADLITLEDGFRG